MASVINQINLNNIEYAIAASAYAECATAADKAEKVAIISTGGDIINTEFTLIKGVAINVKFTVTNSAANPTLKVNSSEAKPIYYKGDAITASYLKANYTYTFVYNGEQWDLVGEIYDDTQVKADIAAAKAEAANQDVVILSEAQAYTDAALGVSGLPQYSAANNAQFLRIINGAPTWSAVPNAEDYSF